MLLISFAILFIFNGLMLTWVCYKKNWDALTYVFFSFFLATGILIMQVYYDLNVDKTITITIMDKDGNQLQTRQYS